ncbi:hypothetical protein ACJZ2D_000827 [Fusarium nematophilum]
MASELAEELIVGFRRQPRSITRKHLLQRVEDLPATIRLVGPALAHQEETLTALPAQSRVSRRGIPEDSVSEPRSLAAARLTPKAFPGVDELNAREAGCSLHSLPSFMGRDLPRIVLTA